MVNHATNSDPPVAFHYFTETHCIHSLNLLKLRVMSLHIMSHIENVTPWKCITACTVATSGCPKTCMAQHIQAPLSSSWFRGMHLLFPTNLFIHIHF